jgi:signal transduction histidine kinase
LALDHRHLQEFTDTVNPTNSNLKQNITDASLGNYAFIWDYEGKSIVHPRHYSIFGYDKNMKKYCKIQEKCLDSVSFTGYNEQACKRNV